MTTQVTQKFLEDFAAAWNRHDVNALLGFVTDDCVFDTSSGPKAFGERHQGTAALRSAFPRIWHLFPDARWEEATHVVSGDRGFSEWTFRGTDQAGTAVETRGIDVFRFSYGKIAHKDTFRKSRTS